MTNLARAHRRYVAAEAKAREAREAFFAAIRAEHAAGKPQRQLARELAYSHQRVGQIVRDGPKRKGGDNFTTTVEGAEAYERLHGGHP